MDKSGVAIALLNCDAIEDWNPWRMANGQELFFVKTLK
jgi:hypothetical protein